jgi:hypothetical protein
MLKWPECIPMPTVGNVEIQISFFLPITFSREVFLNLFKCFESSINLLADIEKMRRNLARKGKIVVNSRAI